MNLIRESTPELLLFHQLKTVLREIEHLNLVGPDKIIIFIYSVLRMIIFISIMILHHLVPVSYYAGGWHISAPTIIL